MWLQHFCTQCRTTLAIYLMFCPTCVKKLCSSLKFWFYIFFHQRHSRLRFEMKIYCQAFSCQKTGIWLANLAEGSVLARNSLTSYFHLKSKPTMPILVKKHLMNGTNNYKIFFHQIFSADSYYKFLIYLIVLWGWVGISEISITMVIIR